VPVNDRASPSAIGGGTQNGGALFATTHWSMVVAAQGESPEADKALGKLCRTYWWPIYSFIRREGARPEEAEDLTQSFFALLFERRDLEGVRREKGRLRSFVFAGTRRLPSAAKVGRLYHWMNCSHASALILSQRTP